MRQTSLCSLIDAGRQDPACAESRPDVQGMDLAVFQQQDPFLFGLQSQMVFQGMPRRTLLKLRQPVQSHGVGGLLDHRLHLPGNDRAGAQNDGIRGLRGRDALPVDGAVDEDHLRARRQHLIAEPIVLGVDHRASHLHIAGIGHPAEEDLPQRRPVLRPPQDLEPCVRQFIKLIRHRHQGPLLQPDAWLVRACHDIRALAVSARGRHTHGHGLIHGFFEEVVEGCGLAGVLGHAHDGDSFVLL